MHVLITRLALTAGLLLVVDGVQAQAKLGFGLRLGGSLPSARYEYPGGTATASSGTGFEAGIVVDFGFSHLSLQPAFLYTQRNFMVRRDRSGAGSPGYTIRNQRSEFYHLGYLTVPFNVVVTPRADGQGLQAFGGAYLALLQGGRFRFSELETVSGPNGYRAQYPSDGEADVEAGDAFDVRSTNFVSRGTDWGLQFGAGYRRRSLLAQLGYTWGLRNLGAAYPPDRSGAPQPAPAYYQRGWQLSLAYLFAPKPKS
jgi:Outer membrane protein beta-barrel domain